MQGIKNLFITGNPKVGKTTLIKNLLEIYPDKFVGFYTQEILNNNVRVGFKIVNTANETDIFALKHGQLIPTKSRNIQHYKKYDIFIDILEKLGVEFIERHLDTKEKKFFVIDEIGSMECLSEKFCNLIVKLIGSEHFVVATLRYNSHPFIDDVKKLSNSILIVLEKGSFKDILNKVQIWIEKNMII